MNSLIQQLLQSNYPSLREALLDKIQEAINTERIFILAASFSKHHVISSFTEQHASLLHVAGLLLLVITKEEDASLHDKESYIEQTCNDLLPVTAIVLRSQQFSEWSSNAHPFAFTIYKKALIIFEKEETMIPGPSAQKDDSSEKEKLLAATINRAEEFLAGTNLFHLRRQNTMAAFMLHQSAEQCLRVLLQITTGYYCNTHSIERLLRINSFLYPSLAEIFPQQTEKDKTRLQLLQKAYIDTRYKEDYCIHQNNLTILTERIAKLKEFLKQEGKRIIRTNSAAKEIMIS
jgi:uncharacterized protein